MPPEIKQKIKSRRLDILALIVTLAGAVYWLVVNPAERTGAWVMMIGAGLLDRNMLLKGKNGPAQDS